MSTAQETPRLWVVTECYPRPGAMSHCGFAHRQMVGLKQAGWDVNVYIPNGWFPPIAWRLAPAWSAARSSSIPSGWQIEGINVSDLFFQNRVPSRLCRPLSISDRIAEALIKGLKKLNPSRTRDILLAQFALPFGPPVRQAARALGLPYVVQLRGDDVWVWPHRSEEVMAAFVRTLLDADLVLGVSQSLIDEARRLAGDCLPPTGVVPNGINLDLFRPAKDDAERMELRREFGLRPGETVLLCVGDALIRKGWIELLTALGSLRASAGSLVLVGAAGTLFSELNLSDEAARLAPDIRFHLMSSLPTDRLAALYRASDIFCLASHWEGLANSLLEAMASGLPVITTAMAGHPEVVSDGVDGFLVPPKTIEPLRAAIVKLMSSIELRRRMGLAARARAESVGSSRKAGERMAALLDGVRHNSSQANLLSENPYAPPINFEGVS